MAYATFKVTPGSAGVDLRENAFAILFLFLSIAAVALRLLVTPEMMNMLMSYSIEGGPFYQKLHLATYAMLAVLFTILVNRLSRPPQLAEEDADVLRSMLRYGAILSAFVVYFVVTSRFSAIGFLIETYLTAVLMVIILLFQSKQARRLVAVAVLCILIASAFVGIVEAILQRHLVSINAGGDFFRAYGLSSHPLALGGQCALAIGFVPLTRWPRWVKVSVILTLILGCVAANARTALAACLLESLLLIVVLRWDGLSRRQERQAKFITLSLVIAFGLALAMLLLSVGLLSRFYSIVDDSSLARVQVYEIFDYVSWTDILFGMDASVLLQVVREKIGIQHIESAPVYFTLLMGLPMAILFTLIVLSYMRRLIGGAATSAKIGSILIILVDLTNNAFATKSVDVLLVSVLLVGLGKVVDTSVTSRRQVMAKAGRSPQVVLRD